MQNIQNRNLKRETKYQGLTNKKTDGRTLAFLE